MDGRDATSRPSPAATSDQQFAKAQQRLAGEIPDSLLAQVGAIMSILPGPGNA